MASLRNMLVLTFLVLSTEESWAATNHVYMYPTWCGTTLEVTAAKVIWPATNYRAEANLYGSSYDCTVVARAEYLNQTINLYANLALSQPTGAAGTMSPVSVAMTTMTSVNITATTQVANSTANVTSGNLATTLLRQLTPGHSQSGLVWPLRHLQVRQERKISLQLHHVVHVFHTGSCEDGSTWLECASGRCIKFHLTCDSANNCGRGDDTDQSNSAPASCSEEEPVAISPDYTPIWVSLGLLGGLLASFAVYWCCWRPGWGPWRLAVLRQLGCCGKTAGSGRKTGAMSEKSGRDGSLDGKSDYGDEEERGGAGSGPASGGLFSCFRGGQPGGPGNTGKVGHAGHAGGRGEGSPKTRWGQQGERPFSGDGDGDVGNDYYRMEDVFYGDVYDIDDYAGGHAREAR
ncbi:uncharacterized protein LOC118417602 [Branchiostoma floridae]|uniref:Uncharacterized protein LOC118417602 n=1 Tax=Branchiostoma floridae TaxID=7739 RepID=A0A9J7LBT3_BRAFL|nr:uncharacterized protein LOC118417602 [Branchiostoma floridae]